MKGVSAGHRHLLTADPRNRPVASDADGNVWQLKDKRSSIRVCVVISRSDVDAVDVPVHPLTDLRLLGHEHRGVVVDVDQVDLQRAGAAGRRGACQQRGERGAS